MLIFGCMYQAAQMSVPCLYLELSVEGCCFQRRFEVVAFSWKKRPTPYPVPFPYRGMILPFELGRILLLSCAQLDGIPMLNGGTSNVGRC